MRKGYLIIAVLSILALSACVTTYQPLARATLNSANSLAAFCDQNGLTSPRIEEAKKLYLEGEKLMEDGKEEEAYVKLELAVLLYRVVIAEHEFALSKERLGQARTRLAEAEEKVEYYDKLLKSLKLPIVETNL